MTHLVTLYYAEVCDSIPGVLSADPERLTHEYPVLVDVQLTEAQAYADRFDHYRARWRFEQQPASIHQHSTVQERTERVLRTAGYGTGYDPKELEELRKLWQQLPTCERLALRDELRSIRQEVQP